MGWFIHHPIGLIYYAPQHCYLGYTLVTTTGGNHATLIDMEGRVCHRWCPEKGIPHAFLLPNGNLLCRMEPSGWMLMVCRASAVHQQGCSS